MLSCGIDSLAIPRTHPLSIRAAVSVSYHGTRSRSLSDFEDRLRGRSSAGIPVAQNAGIDWIPVSTNMWWLVNDGFFFSEKWHGAVLSSIGCFLSRGYDRLLIASSYPLTRLHPWGSHPLIDPSYSCAHFQIHHSGVEMSRFEKTSIVAGWADALPYIRVCQNDNSGSLNCGKCEKCIRTMTTLVALGKLANCLAFSANDVTVELISTLTEYNMLADKATASWYLELLDPLRSRGRADLALALEKVLSESQETRA